jgi:uncharacterized protein (DUF1015 family)
MPDVDAGREARSTPAAARGRRLSLRPFRGLRYANGRVRSQAAVTSPPYDVVDPADVASLERLDPHNVVRLILPRDDGEHGAYAHARDTLLAWQAEGVLVGDDGLAMYVYEQAIDGAVLQRGIIAAVELHDPADRVILPHEDVMPGPVADRLDLMRATRANIEPIFLVYAGGSATVGLVDSTAVRPPELEAVTADGTRHRLWRLSDAADWQVVAEDLATRQALIADGHHRYAAYRQLQAELDTTEGSGGWDAGLALLVDLTAWPPSLGAIHRTIVGLPLEEALRAASVLFDVTAVDLAVPAVAAADRVRPGRLLLVGRDGAAATLEPKDPDLVGDLTVDGRPTQWRGLDTAVLHHVLVERVWGLPEANISYHHTVGQALAVVDAEGGFAVLLAPVNVEQVLAIAAEGVRMPRKSTSFGPKPRTGLVLRSLDEA